MKVSIIIPTFNEADVIELCLLSLKKQTFKDFEIIVVDDGSTEGTLDILNNYKTGNFRLLKQNHKGAGAARNLGADKARGEILVFVDADMTFEKNFLKMLTKPITSGKSKGTFSKDEYVSNWNNPWARCWNINEGWANTKRHPKNYPNKQKVFRAILKKEFMKAGGFTPGGYNDDWSLSNKLGYLADVAPHAVFFHKNPSTLNEVFTHAQWVGKRSYKLGKIGYILALLRSSLPISIIVGLTKSVRHLNVYFLIFKVVYDFGLFVGILKYLLTKKGGK